MIGLNRLSSVSSSNASSKRSGQLESPISPSGYTSAIAISPGSTGSLMLIWKSRIRPVSRYFQFGTSKALSRNKTHLKRGRLLTKIKLSYALSLFLATPKR